MSLPDLTPTVRPATTTPRPSASFPGPAAGGQATRLAVPPGHPRHTAEVARPGAADLAAGPRVIDGEVVGPRIPSPLLPMLAGSGVLFALGVAALVLEAIR